MQESPTPPESPIPDVGTWPRSGSGHDGSEFRGIGGDLLRMFPTDEARNVDVPYIPLTHGSHLVAPICSEPDGGRASSCPVCLTQTELPRTAGGWVPLRCDSCGTDFIASDGSSPPVPSLEPPPTPESVSTAPPRGVRIDSEGRWHTLCPHCRAFDVTVTARFSHTIELVCPSCHGAFVVSHGHSPARLSMPPLPPPPRKVLHTSEVQRTFLGPCVSCPHCGGYNDGFPDHAPSKTTITCPGCSGVFVVEMTAIPDR